jgi:hypothetical protein
LSKSFSSRDLLEFNFIVHVHAAAFTLNFRRALWPAAVSMQQFATGKVPLSMGVKPTFEPSADQAVVRQSRHKTGTFDGLLSFDDRVTQSASPLCPKGEAGRRMRERPADRRLTPSLRAADVWRLKA